MPTPESAGAFDRLVAARERLNAITKLLNEVGSNPGTGKEVTPTFRAQIARHQQLQAEWDEAYGAFEAAAADFSRIVKNLQPENLNRD